MGAGRGGEEAGAGAGRSPVGWGRRRARAWAVQAQPREGSD